MLSHILIIPLILLVVAFPFFACFLIRLLCRKESVATRIGPAISLLYAIIFTVICVMDEKFRESLCSGVFKTFLFSLLLLFIIMIVFLFYRRLALYGIRLSDFLTGKDAE